VRATTGCDNEAIVVTDPDFEKLQAIRSNPGPPGLADLRPDLYRALPAVTVERVTQDPRSSGDDATRSKRLKRPLARVEVAAIVTAAGTPAILRRKRHDTRW
jgi:hypothetical protein